MAHLYRESWSTWSGCPFRENLTILTILTERFSRARVGLCGQAWPGSLHIQDDVHSPGVRGPCRCLPGACLPTGRPLLASFRPVGAGFGRGGSPGRAAAPLVRPGARHRPPPASLRARGSALSVRASHSFCAGCGRAVERPGNGFAGRGGLAGGGGVAWPPNRQCLYNSLSPSVF